jgi:hypothetical protein
MRFSNLIRNSWVQSLLAALLLAGPLWYNGCPLFYPDSIGYIFWGMKGEIVPERVSTYALFIKWCSIGGNIWIPVLVQFGILGFTLRFFWFRILGLSRPNYFFLSCFLLSLSSPLGWTGAMLMPDLFCALSSLFLVLFLEFFSRLKLWERIFSIALFLFFSLFHIGIMPINLLIISAYGIIFLYRKKLKTKLPFLILAFSLTSISYLGIGLVHQFISGQFFTSKTSGAFLVARFAETGLLNEYLNAHCPNPENPLCKSKNAFPMQAEHFLWKPESPLNKEIGLYDPKGVLSHIVKDIFSNPKYVVKFGISGLKSGIKQLFLLDLGDGLGAYPSIQQLDIFTANGSDYLGSKQRGGLDFKSINIWCQMLLLALLFLAIRNKAFFDLEESLEKLGIFIIILLIANALINGALSTPLNRYQVRVFWLVYLWLFAALFPTVKNYFSATSKT